MINLTPDSFSESGPLPTAHSPDYHGLDVGAESTNPRSQAISAEEERARLERDLVPFLSSWPRHLTLSLDTYKLETIRWLAPLVPAGVELVWNDVSGQLDGVREVLGEFPGLKYVACHNSVPTRAQTVRHTDFVSEADIVARVRTFFRHVERELGVERVIADPCFGFAKSREQNLALWDALPRLMDELPFESWLWGISRKRFLRNPETLDPKDPAVQGQLDRLQREMFARTLEKLARPHRIIMRVHNPGSVTSLWKSSNSVD